MPVDHPSVPSPYRLFAGIDIAATTFTAVWIAPKYELESSCATHKPGRAFPPGALACTNLAAST